MAGSAQNKIRVILRSSSHFSSHSLTRYPIPDTRCCCKGYKVTQKSRFTQMLVWKVVQYLCSYPLWLTRGSKVGRSVVVGLGTAVRLISDLHPSCTALYDNEQTSSDLFYNEFSEIVENTNHTFPTLFVFFCIKHIYSYK